MNAGRNHKIAVQWAQANAKLTGTDRYLWIYNGVYWIEKTPPTGAFGSFTYTEVHPDGTLEDKQTTLGTETPNGQTSDPSRT